MSGQPSGWPDIFAFSSKSLHATTNPDNDVDLVGGSLEWLDRAIVEVPLLWITHKWAETFIEDRSELILGI